MKVIDQLVLVGALVGLGVEAIPSVLNPRGVGFSVPVVSQSVDRKNQHFKRSFHAINRAKRARGKGAPHAPDNFQRPAGNSKAKSKAQAPLGGATTSADSENNDTEYICLVKFGEEELRLNFDTGSSDLWVYSTQQPKEQRKNHNVLDPTKTGGTPLTGGTWSISYGDGSSAGGNVYHEKVTVGGVTATQQAVGLATTVSNSFLQDYTNSGLLGLGFSNGNTISVNGKPAPQTTFFENIRSTLPLPLFTVDLKHNATGSYDFGYIDRSKYTDGISYFTADSSQSYWGITSHTYGIKGGEAKPKKIKTIIDTGTTLLLMPQEVIDFYYKDIKGAKNDDSAGGWVYPCDTKLPDFTIGFGPDKKDFTAVIPGKYMDFGPTTTGSKTCFGSMQVMSPGVGLDAIYGDVFLKAVFTVFEAKPNGKPRLGFAMKPDPATASGTTTTTSSSTLSAPSRAGIDCSTKIEGTGPIAWFNIMKQFFTGKKATCPGSEGSVVSGGGDPKDTDPTDVDLEDDTDVDADDDTDVDADDDTDVDSDDDEKAAEKKKEGAEKKKEGAEKKAAR